MAPSYQLVRHAAEPHTRDPGTSVRGQGHDVGLLFARNFQDGRRHDGGGDAERESPSEHDAYLPHEEILFLSIRRAGLSNPAYW